MDYWRGSEPYSTRPVNYLGRRARISFVWLPVYKIVKSVSREERDRASSQLATKSPAIEQKRKRKGKRKNIAPDQIGLDTSGSSSTSISHGCTWSMGTASSRRPPRLCRDPRRETARYRSAPPISLFVNLIVLFNDQI